MVLVVFNFLGYLPKSRGLCHAPSDLVRCSASADGCGAGGPLICPCTFCMLGLDASFFVGSRGIAASPCFPVVASPPVGLALGRGGRAGLPLWVCVSWGRIQSLPRSSEISCVDAFGVGWRSLDFPIVLTAAVRALRARSFPCSWAQNHLLACLLVC